MRAISVSGSAVADRGEIPFRRSLSFMEHSPFCSVWHTDAAPHYKQGVLQSIQRIVPNTLQNLLTQSNRELSPNRTVTTVPASACSPGSRDWEMA